MKMLDILLWASLAATVVGQTAPDFPITVNTNLVVSYGDANVNPPGVLLPRSDVLTAPSVYAPPNATANSSYILFMIDQDVPRNGSLSTLLHWFQPNLAVSSINLVVQSSLSTAIGAPYIPPTPPGGSGPHRYNFILFPQPSNFTVPASFVTINPPAATTARIGFNITEFVAASGLGSPVAANYIRVLNGTAAETSSARQSAAATASTANMASTGTMSSASITGSSASSSTIPSSGSSTMASASSAPSPSQAGAPGIRGSGTEIGFALAAGVFGVGYWMFRI